MCDEKNTGMAFEFDKHSTKTEPERRPNKGAMWIGGIPSTTGEVSIDKVRPNLHAGKVAKWSKQSEKEILEQAHKKHLEELSKKYHKEITTSEQPIEMASTMASSAPKWKTEMVPAVPK